MLKKNKGITLVEAVGVIILGLVLISLALGMYYSGRTQSAVKNEIENSSYILDEIYEIYKGTPNVSSINNQTIIEMGLLPKDIGTSGSNQILSSFNSQITFSPYYSGSLNGFSMEYAEIPSGKPCVDFLKKSSLKWNSFSTENLSVTDFPSQNNVSQSYSDANFLSDVATACFAGDQNEIVDDVTLYYLF